MKGNERLQRGLSADNPWFTGRQFSTFEIPAYRDGILNRWSFFQKCIELQRNKLGQKRLKLLDAGCGDGLNLDFLGQDSNLELWASDYNPVRIQRVRERFSKVRARVEDLLNPLDSSEQFDLILCSQVIEHINDDSALLVNLGIKLAPGGLLIIGTPNEGCFMAWLRNHIFERAILKTTDHVHFYTENELRTRFEQAGLAVKDVMRERFFFPHQRLFNAMLSNPYGRHIADGLLALFPSQTAGYYFALTHKT